MGAVPKRKLSKGRTARRRSHHALKPMHLVRCEQCRALRRPHHVCPTCGTYNGRQVMAVKAKTRGGEAAS